MDWDDVQERGWWSRATSDVLFLATGLVGGGLFLATWLSPLLYLATGLNHRVDDDTDADL